MILSARTNAKEVQRIGILVSALIDSVPDNILGGQILCIIEASVVALILHISEEVLELIQATSLTIRVTIIVDVDVRNDPTVLCELDL